MAEYKEPPHLFITTKEAIAIALSYGIKVTRATVIVWVRNNHLGHNLGGDGKGSRWVVHKRRWEDFITGRNKKLPGENYDD